ncbi:Tubulin/FtsZ, GTPase domain containing protein [Trema orientale]|uniref:Tubulin/FtsZ, GTPase domain containing protein n=1 Tax=Trema orientale TaxID=63057 RepID=A0A2P5EAE2_TREOI|nr:Tubulin/FtsZ, GTPase domain containing protein [Trema orientale]
MERPVFTSFSSWSSLASSKPTIFFHKSSLRCRNFTLRWNGVCASKPHLVRIAATSAHNSPPKAETELNFGNFWTDPEMVEVIAIGSRKDAILNFCLDSPFQSPSLRFWNIVVKDSTNVQLQQRILGKDPTSRNFEPPPSSLSSSKTIILVASAGYGMDHISAIDILKTISSANGFTVTIILKPFSFEGQRRHDEVRGLMEKIQEHTSILIDLDTDKLLKKDLVTLDEAVKTANNAVLMAITAVMVLKSDMHRKLIGPSCNNMREIEVSEVFSVSLHNHSLFEV